MADKKIRIVMLCGDGQSTRIMFNGLASDVNIECVIIENKPSSKIMIQRRIKKLGLMKVTGQLFFLVLNKLFAKLAQTRITQLIAEFQLNDEDIPNNIVQRVGSINCEDTISLLRKINPDAVVVNGTRIISTDILSSINAPFINTHMGITPRYRGVHGGYWALANADGANCGVTVHLVDQGIDTGGVLYQDIIHVDKHDNFNTYPVHQIAKAIPLMKAALIDVKEQRINVKQGVFPSHLWYHPTLFEYVKHWLKNGVR
jgi:folate-dependent phosphoribosylglycinamide formyltransferase PurN